MNFDDLNNLIKCVPFWFHVLTSAVLIGGLASLILKYSSYVTHSFKLFGVRQSLLFFASLNTPCFTKRLVLFASIVFNFFAFFGKISSPEYTMLDIFLPLYVCYYFLAKETIMSLDKEMITFKKMCTNETIKTTTNFHK